MFIWCGHPGTGTSVPSIRAYHGTTLSFARTIIAQQHIKISRNDYDWLGRGAYFFQDGPLQAWKWAAHWVGPKFSEPPAVVSADLDLTDCFDLLDLANWRFVLDAHQVYSARFAASGRPLPTQRAPVVRAPNGQHFHVASPLPPSAGRPGRNLVDCAVIRLAVRRLRRLPVPLPINSVRGSFVQGQQLYDNSYFFDHSHVQIAVLNPTAVASNFVLEDSQLLAQKYALSGMTRWPV